MCTWHYMHHHHNPPCNRPIDMVVHYSYCADATATPGGGRLPCNNTQWDESAGSYFDYNNPCASGGCLYAPDCPRGSCRVEQLGGRWICCSCGGPGNEYHECYHTLPHSPDTFCYHLCCGGCWPDSGGSTPSSSSSPPGPPPPPPPPGHGSSSKRRRH